MVKKVKETLFILMVKLSNTDNYTLVAYHDAPYANLKDERSQGDVMLSIDNNGKYMSPIAWQSKRIKHVVKRILAAETLSPVEAAFPLPKVIEEILYDKVL